MMFRKGYYTGEDRPSYAGAFNSIGKPIGITLGVLWAWGMCEDSGVETVRVVKRQEYI